MDRLQSQAGSQQRQQLQLQQVLQAGILRVWERQARDMQVQLVPSEQSHKQVALVEQPLGCQSGHLAGTPGQP